MIDREQEESSRPTLFGSEFLSAAATALGSDDPNAWDSVARAAVHLKRIGYIDWRYVPTPNVDPPEPPLEFIDNGFLQRVQEIHVTAHGHAALAARQQGTQINVVNSTVGQLALGNIQNIDVLVILDAMEQSLGAVDASEAEKTEARLTIQRMRDAAANVAGSATSSVLAAALRQALGLP
ncbi:MAG TPA: hypothetical protein VFI09_00855 [Solirubrobacterales bacterium]|nr:hypothetical protein [Solirubrobacterales bacterium]